MATVICNGAPQSEFDYVRSLPDRIAVTECRGPALTLSIPRAHLECLEAAVEGRPVATLLWANFLRGSRTAVEFRMCAAHWMDLSYQAGCQAKDRFKITWFEAADALLVQMCAVARWDSKELANLLTWQRVELT